MKFLRLLKRKPNRTPPRAPDGQRIYAIGDVHGRYDLMCTLMDRIAADSADRSAADTHVVFLGDLIDRGPQSAEIIDYLMNARLEFASLHFLLGNHEQAMLASFEDMADPRKTGWLDYGGRETLASYGVPASAYAAQGWLLSDELRRYVPEAHLRFLGELRLHLRMGDYLFVHAGIRPNVPLERQTQADLCWIRSPFLEDERDHGFTVVHGHTVTTEPQFRANRIGIDTGAYKSGVLTALGLEGERQ